MGLIMSEENQNSVVKQIEIKKLKKKNMGKKIIISVVIFAIATIFLVQQRQQQTDKNTLITTHQDLNLKKSIENSDEDAHAKKPVTVNKVISHGDKALNILLPTRQQGDKEEEKGVIASSEQPLSNFENTLVDVQTNNKSKVIPKEQKSFQKRVFSTIGSLFKNQEEEAKKDPKEMFELVGISIWDSQPKATIRYNGHTSIVSVGSIRINWKIINIDFNKEQITILKNGQQIVLDKIK
ncbi:hypothetical protein BTHERMOSOX_1007 [Bathymodiolus thermophilus thioautotrophic gill symbiont]|nr:hypothetical protein BTHERMOSOX_1007 [Bathymodiolus thermophilus thioautotrophic gill symbiont]